GEVPAAQQGRGQLVAVGGLLDGPQGAVDGDAQREQLALGVQGGGAENPGRLGRGGGGEGRRTHGILSPGLGGKPRDGTPGTHDCIFYTSFARRAETGQVSGWRKRPCQQRHKAESLPSSTGCGSGRRRRGGWRWGRETTPPAWRGRRVRVVW